MGTRLPAVKRESVAVDVGILVHAAQEHAIRRVVTKEGHLSVALHPQ